MNCLLTAVLFALPAARSPGQEESSPAPTVTFGTQTPEVGTSRSLETSEDVTVALMVKGGEREQDAGKNQVTSTMAWTEKVLESGSDGPSKLAVSYGDCTSRISAVQGSMDLPVPVSGKSYLATRSDPDHVITTEEGDAIEGPEAAQVSKDAGHGFGTAPLGKVLSGSPRSVGEQFEIPAEVLERVFHKKPTAPCPARLVEMRESSGRQVGVFELEMQLRESVQGQFDLTIDLKGKVLIDVETSRLAGAALSGPVTVSGSVSQGAATVEFSGSGEARIGFQSGSP